MVRPSYKYSIIQAPTLPAITFHNEDGEDIASFRVNEKGKLEIETDMEFSEAGKQSAKVFWESFSYYLKEEWNKWANQNPLNT
jgi:hypothetical protein